MSDTRVLDRWTRARRSYAEQILRDARAALRSVEATCSHNFAPEWQEELQRCRRNVQAAEESLRQFDEEDRR